VDLLIRFALGTFLIDPAAILHSGNLSSPQSLSHSRRSFLHAARQRWNLENARSAMIALDRFPFPADSIDSGLQPSSLRFG
jgi:hypothetical protein